MKEAITDDLLEMAITNWAPRFTANGVDVGDYARITQGLTQWDDWCDAWCEGAAQHVALGESAWSEDRYLSAGECFSRAATYYHFGKFLFVHRPDQARIAHQKSVEVLNRSLPLLSPPGSRHEIPFETSKLVGIFRAPHGVGPHPTVLLVAGLDSTKEEFREVERAFLDRGVATFAFDGPGQGEAEATLPIRPDWGEVGAAVFDYLATLREVAINRVGVWGVSLGGYYAARLAAADLPIKATICLSGPYDFGSAWSHLNPLTQQAFEVRSHSSSPAQAAERARLLNLEGIANKITSPLLVIMGQRDRLFPWRDAERLVNEAQGESTLVLMEEGNHGCANVVYQHRPLSADWMAGELRRL
jgi:2,6-dihydroxypseudooxynicotine hydrolase